MRWLFLLFLFTFSSAWAESKTIGVVIGAENGQLRRVIIPDNDEQLTKQNWVSEGERLLIMDRTVSDITAEITKQTGLTPTEPRAAIVDKDGIVQKVIVADPLIDKVPDGDLVEVSTPEVKAGDFYDAKTKTFTDAETMLVREPKPLEPAEPVTVDQLESAVPAK